MSQTLIFDIGKTNKKVFVFDKDFQVLINETRIIDEIKDEDGFPCDDLATIQVWIQEKVRYILKSSDYHISGINFSTYGASFVHVGADGAPRTCLYNYMKPIPESILDSFYHKYGQAQSICLETSSPSLAMLNSGLQLYWLKHSKPDLFNQIKWSLHFPQYLSFLFTRMPSSDFTSIGCHTALWDFTKEDYHSWVYRENMDQKLGPISKSSRIIQQLINGKKVNFGLGIHDSSSALLPYLIANDRPFVLISTGTWSITLNPFSRDDLNIEDLEHDCLNYLGIDGKKVRASRLFLGEEHGIQASKLESIFDTERGAYKRVKFDQSVFQNISRTTHKRFRFQHLKTSWEHPGESALNSFKTFEEAYHQLIWELVLLQVKSSSRAIGSTQIDCMYVDGGFSNNEVFMQMLASQFEKIEVYSSDNANGSALGAALVMSGVDTGQQDSLDHYALKAVRIAEK